MFPGEIGRTTTQFTKWLETKPDIVIFEYERDKMIKRNYMKTAFVGGQLIIGNGENAVQDCLVMINEGKIIYAGKKDADDAPDTDGYEIVNIKGKTIMPGLIDTHLHFSGNLNDKTSDWVREPLLQKAVVAVQQAHDCLEHGLTTVGEISRFGIHIRNMINNGEMKGPRVIASGRGFCATGSHGDAVQCSPQENYDSHPWAEVVDGPWELRKAVRNRLRECPDAIKIWATGGGTYRYDTSRDYHYNEEEIRATVEEARMRNVPVWAHTCGSCKTCVDAGADFIIHGFGIEEESMDIMAEKGYAFCPTLNFLPEWLGTYPPEYIPEIHDLYEGDTLVEKELNRLYDSVSKAFRKGVMITAGSDSFNSDSTPYGTVLTGEVHVLADHCGMSPMDAIVAATANGAKALRCYDVTGSIETGKSADMLIIDGDPLADIHDICVEKMAMIIKEGERV